MGKKGSKMENSPSFDHIKSVKKSINIRTKNIPINSINRSMQIEKIIPISNEKSSSSSRLVENMILVWLDISSEKQTDTTQKTLNSFRRVIHLIRTFIDIEKCFEFLNSIENEKILFIVSGSFGPQILPRIDNLNQIYSIYIFCSNKSNHIEWTKTFKKIRGIHTQIKELCDALRYDNNQYDKSLTAISMLPPIPVMNLNETNKHFIYLQLMKSILLEIQYDRKFRRELMIYSRQFYLNNEQQLNIIDSFDDNYQLHSPIWWYTRRCFIYKMLRKAFYDQDFEIIYKLAFFIRDLHRDIKKAYLQSHTHQYNPINIFRTARMKNIEFESLNKNLHGLLSFNDFVLATLERSIALKFAHKLLNDSNIIVVIYKIDIDPTESSIPFIALDNLTYLSDTNGEILLSMNTIFHIDLIDKLNDRLYEVKLSPVNKNDQQIVNLVGYMQKITCGLSGWYRLSKIMMEVHEYDQVINIYKSVYNQTHENQHEERAFLLHELGYVNDLKNDLSTSISYYQQALEVYIIYLSVDHPSLLSTYTNLADVMQKKGDLNGALLQYQNALRIKNPTDPNVIVPYNNIGDILQQQKKYSEAQQTYEKAINILLRDFPSAQDILMYTYYNLAGLFYTTKEYSKASAYYEKILAIEEKSLSLNYSFLTSLYFNLATTYEGDKDFKQAIDYAEKSIKTAGLAYGNGHVEVKENRDYLEQLQSKFQSVKL